MPQLPKPPADSSKMADMLSGVTSLLQSLNPFGMTVSLPQGRYPSLTHPSYHSFNERFTRTPGVVVPSLPAYMDAKYQEPGGFPGEGDRWGTITIKPDAESNTISHEAAHSIYNRAGLYRWYPALNAKMNKAVSKMVSSLNANAIAQDKSALSDEGLGYAMDAPTPADESYVNYAASYIEDPVLRERLLKMLQHAKAMSSKEWIAEKKRLQQEQALSGY